MTDPQLLISRYLGGSFSPEDLAELRDWILAAHANAMEFARAAYTHTLLHQMLNGQARLQDISDLESGGADKTLFGLRLDLGQLPPSDPSLPASLNDLQMLAGDADEAPSTQSPATQPSPSMRLAPRAARSSVQRRWMLRFASAAAILAVCSLLAFHFLQNPPATFTASIDATLDDGASVTGDGKALVTGVRRTLSHGFAQMTFANGARVIVEAPATFTIVSPSAMSLESGKICATAEGNAHGFEVRTPTVTVTDLGTEFGVSIDADGNTNIAVFRGKVELQAAHVAGDASARTLAEGQAADVASDGASVSDAPWQPLAFVRSLDEAQSRTKASTSAQLLAWWRFEDLVPPPPPSNRARPMEQPDVIADSSGHGNALTWWPGNAKKLIGNYRSSPDVPPQSMFRPGFTGGAQSFASGPVDPSLRGVLFCDVHRHGPAFSLPGSFTFEAFFKTAGDQSGKGALDILAEHPSKHPRFVLGLNGDLGEHYGTGGIGFTVFDAARHPFSVSLSDRNYADGTWHYVAVFYDRQAETIRLCAREDGASRQKSLKLPPGFVLAAFARQNLHIGCRDNEPSDQVQDRFQGLLDEIRISSGIVPDTQLMAPVTEP